MLTETSLRKKQPFQRVDALSKLKNVGPATRECFRLLGIETAEQLAEQDADDLYSKLSAKREASVDPCMHDIFTATIHQAQTGEAFSWWHFSDARKQRQKAGDFPRSFRI